MTPLALRPLPAFASIAALTAIVLFVDLPFTGLWAVVISDSAHGPVCAGIAGIVFHLINRPVTQRWWMAIAATTLLGIVIELVQGIIGRDAEVVDVMTDVLGALAGTGLCVAFARDSSLALIRAGVVSMLVAIALLAVPVVSMIGAYVTRSERFPVLMDGNATFGTAFVSSFWTDPTQETLPPAANPKFTGERGLRVRAAPPQLWWSIALGELQQLDWRPWKTLVIEVFNPRGRSVPFHVRVFDQPDGLANDRGHMVHTRLEPGRSAVRLQLADMKNIDLSHIYGMILFTASGDVDDDLYFLNIRLE
jgi:hypothetical protein